MRMKSSSFFKLQSLFPVVSETEFGKCGMAPRKASVIKAEQQKEIRALEFKLETLQPSQARKKVKMNLNQSFVALDHVVVNEKVSLQKAKRMAKDSKLTRKTHE